ncbi:MAG: N-acetylmuramoyl-L-alanine amidase [Pseudolabrys sp.]|nr:N-acetylmuramoyl-L-alanine amidase [Pseudolabrys sp.]
MGFVAVRFIAAVIAITVIAPGAVLAPAPVRADGYPVATEARIGGDAKGTRFVVDFTQKVDAATFTLADPYRVVVDLPQVVFKLPAKAGETGRGLIKAFRYGLVMQGGSRIVIDTSGPVKVEKAFALPAADGQPARLVLDLTATDRDAFMRNVELEHHAARTPKRASLPAVADDPRPLIVIDPGHGGIDTGTKGPNGETEKSIVLDFATALRKKLEQSGKYRVAMTRSDDTFIPLMERVQIARQLKASLFISVHADYLPKREGEAHGATVYTLSDKASDAEAQRLADSENKADAIAGVDLASEPDDVSNILIDLAQRETKTFSVQFARDAVSSLKAATRVHKSPLKAAGFVVLRAPDVPSVLVELGYVSDKADLKDLLSADWRNRTAGAIASAVDTYFSSRLAGVTRGAD